MYERILDGTKKITLIVVAIILVILLLSIALIHWLTAVPALEPQQASLPDETKQEETTTTENPPVREGEGFTVIHDGKAADGQE